MGVFDDIKDSIPGSGSSGSSSRSSSSSTDFGGSDDFNDDKFSGSFDHGGSLGDQGESLQSGQGPQSPQQGLNSGQPNNPQDGSGMNDGPEAYGQQPPPKSQPGGNQNARNRNSPPAQGHNGRKPQAQGDSVRQHGRNMRNQSGQSSQQGSPNAQAGRPQEGSSEPQLSSQTRRKLDNAGLSDPSPPENQGGGSQEGRSQREPGRNNQSPETVSESRDDIEHLKAQNQQIIELLKRINENLNGSRR